VPDANSTFPAPPQAFLPWPRQGPALTRADSAGWSGVNVALVAAGLGFAALFFLRARRAAQPLIDLSVFRSPRFGLVLFMSLVSSGCYVAAVFVVSAYLQDVRDLSAIEASAVLAVMAALVAVAAPVGARLRPHVGPILVMAGGV
jgi:hypothetical protein